MTNLMVEELARRIGPRLWEESAKINYEWKMPRSLAATYKVDPGGSLAEQAMELRRKMHELFAVADEDGKRKLIFDYVVTWGGIKAHARGGDCSKTLASMATQTPQELMKRFQGVSTWSKILCLHDPGLYAIFDARVAFAINALQISIANLRPVASFPLLPTRNTHLVQATSKVKVAMQSADPIPEDRAYATYLALLEQLADARGIEVVEMALFTIAPEFARRLNAGVPA